MLFFKTFLLSFLIILNFPTIFGIDLGDNCVSNYYCSYIPNAECQNNICQCMKGTTQYNFDCLEEINPKISCSNSNDCKLLQSICVEGSCKCVHNHHFRDGECHYNKPPRAPCNQDKECYQGMQFIGSMICKQFSCKCNDGYQFIEGRCRNGSIKNIAGLNYLLLLAIITLTIITLTIIF